MGVYLYTEHRGPGSPWLFVDEDLDELANYSAERSKYLAGCDRLGETDRDLELSEAVTIARTYIGVGAETFGDDQEAVGMAMALAVLLDVLIERGIAS